MEDILAITLIFGGGTLFLLSISPIGKAIADRIGGRGRSVGDARESDAVARLEESQTAVLEELDLLRGELSDVQERLDFTERLLARQRELGELPAPERRADAGDDVQS